MDVSDQHSGHDGGDAPAGGLGARLRRAGEDGRVPSWLATTTAWTWRLLVILVGAFAILYLLTRLYLVTLPIIVAIILATLCVPVARALQRRRVPRVLAATITVIGGLGVVSGIIAALVPIFVREIGELVETVQEGVEQILVFLEENFGWGEEEVSDLLDQGFTLVQEQSGQIAQQALTGAAIFVQAITAIVLAIVLLFFFVKDGEQIVGWMIDRTPPDYRDTMRAVGRRGWTALAGFVRGTAAIALIDAIGIGVGLAILGVPAVLPIAVLVFLGGFIPVIGAFVTGLLAVLVALAAGGLQVALIALAIVVGVQQFESNVLQPVIMRRAVSLHPVVILSALTAGAVLLGIIGAFLAVPIAAVTAAIANELRLRHEADMITRPPDAAGRGDLGRPLSEIDDLPDPMAHMRETMREVAARKRRRASREGDDAERRRLRDHATSEER
jgi:putative heme transporter